MTQVTWEKTSQTENAARRSGVNWKFVIAGLLILAAVGYLIVSGTMSGARYFITINEVTKDQKYVGQIVRISGAVIGDSIKYDTKNLTIDFTIVHIPEQTTDLAQALHDAVYVNTGAPRVKVHIENQVKPDLLQDEAQAIVTGKLGEDGVFYATELLLKCPSRYGEADPAKAIAEPGTK